MRVKSYSHQDISINPNGLGGWEIIDNQGVKYIFGVNENKNALEESHVELVCNQGYENFQNYTSAWHLLEIISPNGKKISFNYQLASTNVMPTKSHSRSIRTLAANQCQIQWDQICETTIPVLKTQQLTSIEWDHGKVNFTANTERLDVPSINEAKMNQLDAVRIVDSKDSLIKEYKLTYSYLGSLAPQSKKHLLLKSIQERGVLNEKPAYLFNYYDEDASGLGSNYAQDHWGFYNGYNSNNNLIPKNIKNSLYDLLFKDCANREPSFEHALIGQLKEVTFPTGGKNSYEYEPHQAGYIQDKLVNDKVTATKNSIAKVSNLEPLNTGFKEDYKTIDINYNQTVKIKYKVSTNGYPIALDPPTVKITNLETNEIIFSDYSDSEKEEVILLELEEGAYELLASVMDKGATALIEMNYMEQIGITNIREVGGVRLKKQVLTVNGEVQILSYKYLMDKNTSSGVLSFEPYYEYKSGKVHAEHYKDLPTECSFRTRKGISINPLAHDGAHIGYRRVKVSYGSNAENGSTDYHFSTAYNYPTLGVQGPPFPFATPISHKKGKLLKKTDFTNQNIKLANVEKTYIYRQDTNFYGALSVFISHDMIWFNHPDILLAPFKFDTRSSYIEWGYLEKDTQTTYSQENPNDSLVTTTIYHYDNPAHAQLSRSITVNSVGDTLISKQKYPLDYSSEASVGIAGLQDRHMIAPVIEQQQWLKKDGNQWLTGSKVTKFTDFDGKILPESVWLLPTQSPLSQASYTEELSEDKYIKEIPNNLLEKRASYLSYDELGNITSYAAEDNVPQSFIWGYDGSYPIAKAMNASPDELAYTSFESNDAGGWNFDSNLIAEGGISGKYGYQGTAQKANLPLGKYYLSFWQTDQAVPNIIGGFMIDAKPGLSQSGWQHMHYELEITDAQNEVQVAGMGKIDELRLYPVRSQMETYTYKPLIGMSTATDANNRMTHYGYDDLSRLDIVRDAEQNIRGMNQYYYQQGEENSPIWENTGTMECQTVNQSNTGIALIEQEDINPGSPTFGQTQWIEELNLELCPVGNCEGDDKKWIDGACYTGTRYNVNTYQVGDLWFCEYKYYWAQDNSCSQLFVQKGFEPCEVHPDPFCQ